MEADTGKQEHGKEEKQHSHSNSHHQNQREKHVVGGSHIGLEEYIDHDAQSVSGGIKYKALTGKKSDKVEGLIGPENIVKDRKQEEEGEEKNKGVVYEF
ncbi:unnamed protein product [Urochloa humidicola]